jgi:predicted RNase H-like HicB family nuclease
MGFSFDSKLASKRYAVVVEKGDSSYGAYVPNLPGCVAVGQTEDETNELIREAIELHLEDIGNA